MFNFSKDCDMNPMSSNLILGSILKCGFEQQFWGGLCVLLLICCKLWIFFCLVWPVHCESCIIVPEDGVTICSICENPHPSGMSNVFLLFDHFLEEHFREEYDARRKNVEHIQMQFRSENSSACMVSFLLIMSTTLAWIFLLLFCIMYSDFSDICLTNFLSY